MASDESVDRQPVRGLTHAERRLRNTRALVDRVEARLSHIPESTADSARDALAAAREQLTQAERLVTHDPAEAEQALDEVRRLAETTEATIDRRTAGYVTPGVHRSDGSRSWSENVTVEDAFDLLGWLGRLLGGGRH